MNEQDSLSTYALWAKQAAILEEPSEYDTKTLRPRSGTGAYAAKNKENIRSRTMEETNRQEAKKATGGNGKEAKQNQRQPSVVTPVSEDEEDTIMYADDGTQTTPDFPSPYSLFSGQDGKAAGVSQHMSALQLGENEHGGRTSVIQAAKTKRVKRTETLNEDIKPTDKPADVKQSWSKRALSRTKDILSITAKEPSTLAFEEFRNREFKRAGVKPGDNAAAKLHVSSQKLPPEALDPKSREPPPISRNPTDANTTANKSVGKLATSRSKSAATSTNHGGRGKASSTPSLASSASRDSSAMLGSARVSFQGSASGTSGSGSYDNGPPRLRHSQTDGSGGARNIESSGNQSSRLKLDKKQKAAAIDDRW